MPRLPMQKSAAMKTVLAIALASVVGIAVVLAVRGQQAGSGASAAPSTAASPATTQGQAAGAVVADVDGQLITADQVDKALGPALDKLEQQVYEMRRQQLDQLIAQKLIEREATRRGVSVDALLTTEVTDKAAPVTDADVEQFFEANKSRLPTSQPNLKAQIKQYLTNQREQARHDQFVKSLREGAKVSVSLAPPPVTRVTLDLAGAPSRGPANAPITLVEFSDFHCPYCQRVKPTIAELLARYPDKIRLVFKDLPLDSLHPAARAAAEAAQCANDQGKFWPFHDKVYERAPDASPATLKAIATEVGLDVPAFEQCVSSRKHEATVQRSVDEAEGFGVTGTPAFFVNGRLIAGALPLDAFTRVIDEELAGTVKTR
jgi:protein-disulfide isomerase